MLLMCSEQKRCVASMTRLAITEAMTTVGLACVYDTDADWFGTNDAQLRQYEKVDVSKMLRMSHGIEVHVSAST